MRTRLTVLLSFLLVAWTLAPAASAHHWDGYSPIVPFGAQHHGGETLQAEVGDTLHFGSRWGACTRGLARAYAANVDVTVWVDDLELEPAGWSNPTNPPGSIADFDFDEGCTPSAHGTTGWWVFWKAPYTFTEAGLYTVSVEVIHAEDVHDGAGTDISAGTVISGEVYIQVGHPIVLHRLFGGGEDVFAAGQVLADAMSDATDGNYFVAVADTPAELVDVMCSDPRSAVGVVPTAIYALASADCGVDASFEAERFGADHSRSQFLVHTGSTATGLADLEGLTWAFSSLTSYSGYMVPLGMLNQAGVEAVPLDPVITHIAAAQAVHAGTADFATTFESPNLEGLNVRALAYSEEIPNDAIAFGAEFPEDLRIEVEAFLWGDGRDTLLQSMDTLYPPWGWGDIVEADDADWDWFRDILSWAGIGIGDL